jgi:ornithine decarboxylase antizyme 1
LNHENHILYVALPSALSHEASKHSFISLLEFAEEKLECGGVILCFRKTRSDRANLVRTFLFLGFQPLNPQSPLLATATNTVPADDDNMFMIYSIE